MLHELVTANRSEVIRRCRENAARRFAPAAVPAAADLGVPLFLRQVVDTLRAEQQTPVREPPDEPAPAPTEIGRAAALHGRELRRLGYTVDQVVHEYGDICQAVTAIAVESRALISADEFRTLNRCLDNAIADAVTSYADAQQRFDAHHEKTLNDHLVALSEEHQRLIKIAIGSYSAIKTGNVGLTGATGTLLVHALNELLSLVDSSIPEIRRAANALAGVPLTPNDISAEARSPARAASRPRLAR